MDMFTKSNTYINYIDGLRAFAVLAVILFHLNVPIISGGFVGVDVFFVISGFLITRLMIKEIDATGTLNITNFYYRRIKRIFPALFFTLLGTWLAGMFLFSPGDLRSLGASIAAAALSLSNVLFWRECGYFDAAAEFKPLLHTWSLGVEEQFYFIWPFILFFVAVKHHKKYLPQVILLLGLLSLALNLGLQKKHLNALYYLMPFRFFEFCIGALTVWAMPYRPKNKFLEEALCLAGLALLFGSVFFLSENQVFPSYNALFPTVGAALIIYAGGCRYTGTLFSNRVAVGIGLISYSLYLVHWPLIVFYSYFINSAIHTQAAQCAILGACILLAGGMYFFIEQPFRRTGIHDKKKQMVLILPWVPAITFTACCGLAIYLGNGMPWRIPNEQRQQYKPHEIAQNYHKTHFGGQGFAYPFGWTYQTGTNQPDIVLLGDSHAQMLQYGLAREIGKKYHKAIYMAGSSCLILPGLVRTTVGEDWHTICPNVLKQGMAELQKKKDSILILSQSWLFQILKAGDLKTGEPWQINTTSSKRSDYAPLLAKLRELRQMIGHRTLIIIGDVPGAGIKDPFSCLTRPAIAQAHCINQINVAQETTASIRNINRVLRYFASKEKNTYFLDPYPIFCNDTTCRALNDQGKPYYSDNNHLSKIGSRYLIARLKPQLLPLLHTKTA